MPAKEVALELGAQRLGRQIFQRPRLAVDSMSDVCILLNILTKIGDVDEWT